MHDHQQIMTHYLSELVMGGGGVIARPCSDCDTVLHVSYFGASGQGVEMREIGGGRELSDD